MQYGLLAALTAASALALAAPAANATVYILDSSTVGTVFGCEFCEAIFLSGTITTDGDTGFLSAADITGWDITLTFGPGPFSILDMGPRPNSFLSLGGLFATSSGLFFDFGSGGSTGPTLSFSDFNGIGVNWTLEPGLEEVLYSYDSFGSPRDAELTDQSGCTEIASVTGTVSGPATCSAVATPEPATWTLMLAGFAGLGAMLRQRRPIQAP